MEDISKVVTEIRTALGEVTLRIPGSVVWQCIVVLHVSVLYCYEGTGMGSGVVAYGRELSLAIVETFFIVRRSVGPTCTYKNKP